MTEITKKATREALSPLWKTISRSDNYSAKLEIYGGNVLVERVYHRGRIEPAWTASWSFYVDGKVKLQSDMLSTFVDQIHRFHLNA